MAFNVGNFPAMPMVMGVPYTASGISTVALLSTVFRTSGSAMGVKFSSPVTGTLTDAYVFVTSGNTTPALRATIYTNDSASATPNTPALGNTSTVNTTVATNNWVRFAALDAPLVLGRNYWFFLGDEVLGDTVTIQLNSPVTGLNGSFFDYASYSGTNGGATMTILPGTSGKGCLVLKFTLEDDSTYVYGMPYTTSANDTSNTLERGNLITGLENDIEVCGVLVGGNVSGTCTGVKIYSSASGPGSSTLLSLTFPDGSDTSLSPLVQRELRFDPITLSAGGTYVVSLTYDVADTGPGYYTITDAARYTDVAAAAYGGTGNMYRVIDNGAGGWTGDTTSIERIALMVNPLYTASSSGTADPTRPWGFRPSGVYRP